MALENVTLNYEQPQKHQYKIIKEKKPMTKTTKTTKPPVIRLSQTAQRNLAANRITTHPPSHSEHIKDIIITALVVGIVAFVVGYIS